VLRDEFVQEERVLGYGGSRLWCVRCSSWGAVIKKFGAAFIGRNRGSQARGRWIGMRGLRVPQWAQDGSLPFKCGIFTPGSGSGSGS